MGAYARAITELQVELTKKVAKIRVRYSNGFRDLIPKQGTGTLLASV